MNNDVFTLLYYVDWVNSVKSRVERRYRNDFINKLRGKGVRVHPIEVRVVVSDAQALVSSGVMKGTRGGENYPYAGLGQQLMWTLNFLVLVPSRANIFMGFNQGDIRYWGCCSEWEQFIEAFKVITDKRDITVYIPYANTPKIDNYWWFN